MGRGLMADPRLMLLDEPSMGLAPILVAQIFEIIQDINEQGVSILLVEQNAQMALSIADRPLFWKQGKSPFPVLPRTVGQSPGQGSPLGG